AWRASRLLWISLMIAFTRWTPGSRLAAANPRRSLERTRSGWTLRGDSRFEVYPLRGKRVKGQGVAANSPLYAPGRGEVTIVTCPAAAAPRPAVVRLQVGRARPSPPPSPVCDHVGTSTDRGCPVRGLLRRTRHETHRDCGPGGPGDVGGTGARGGEMAAADRSRRIEHPRRDARHPVGPVEARRPLQLSPGGGRHDLPPGAYRRGIAPDRRTAGRAPRRRHRMAQRPGRPRRGPSPRGRQPGLHAREDQGED